MRSIFFWIKGSWIFLLGFILGIITTLVLQRIDFNQFLPWSWQSIVEAPKDTQPQPKKELTVSYFETSPDGNNDIILYRRSFLGKSDFDYKNYLSNQYFFVVRESESWQERYIYVGDYRVGNPHWLGNDFIFFTTGCGTECKGLEIVNINSRKPQGAVITTISLSKGNDMTVFLDWFGHEYKFPGWNKNIRSVYLDGKAYLIFEMWNNEQPIGEKRFLFTGDALVEQ